MATALVTILLVCGPNTTLLEWHNVQRTARQLPILQVDAGLMTYAQRHADGMARSGRLQHQSLSAVMQKGWMTAGENIAEGQQTQEEVMHSWMKSPGHRSNILSRKFSHIGFGSAVTPTRTHYWCVIFAGR